MFASPDSQVLSPSSSPSLNILDPRINSIHLNYMGMKKELAGQSIKPRLPFTSPILKPDGTLATLNKECDHIMVWTAMCLCFFGFLCAGEAVAPDNSDFDPPEHLTYADPPTSK